MPHHRWSRPLAALALCGIALAGPALAEEGGEVVLTVDGEEVVFPLWAGQSDWSDAGALSSVNIYARPTDEETWARFKTFTLGFSGPTATPDLPEASLTRVAGDAMQKLFSEDEQGGLTVAVDEARVEGEFLTVTGTFSGDFGTSENYGSDIDLSAPVPISGTFAVTLGPVE
jgi:hypothetical protein